MKGTLPHTHDGARSALLRRALVERLSAGIGRLRPSTIRGLLLLLLAVALVPALAVQASLFYSRFETQRATELLWHLSALSLLATAVAFLAALAIGRAIIQPVGRLREHALAIGRGEFGGSVGVDGPAELEQLADALNRMNKEILARERQHDRLLEQIKETNQQLVLSNLRNRELAKEAGAARDTLQAVMENTHALLAYLDPFFNLVLVNSAYVRASGHTTQELIGRHHFDLFPNPENQAIFEKVRDTGEPVRFRARPLEYADQLWPGITYWDWTLVPVKDGSGRVQGLVFSLLDVTESVRAQEAVRASEEAQRFLAEAGTLLASSLDYTTTLQSVVRLAVPRLAVGCTVDLVEGQSLRQVAVAHVDPTMEQLVRDLRRRYPPNPDHPHPLWDVVRTGRPQVVSEMTDSRLAALARDQEHLAMLRQVRGKPRVVVPLTARGRTLGTISFWSAESGRSDNLVDLALAEELARRAALAVDNALLYREAQEAISARDEFLSVAAHELKTPITSLRGFAQLTIRRLDREGSVDPDRLRQALQVIDQQSDKLARLVSQLLDVSRIEAGRLVLAPRLTDLCKLVEDLVANVRTDGSLHNLVLCAPLPALAHVDPLRIEQVVTNLIDNAVKYSPGGGQVDVEVSSPDVETVRISVRDRGIGIPPEHQDRIFDRFYQAHGYFGGMGLGLYISREIVGLHGGTIDMESPPDGGTRFVVSLPVGLGETEREPVR